MIHVVTAANRRHYVNAIEEHHLIRHKIVTSRWTRIRCI